MREQSRGRETREGKRPKGGEGGSEEGQTRRRAKEWRKKGVAKRCPASTIMPHGLPLPHLPEGGKHGVGTARVGGSALLLGCPGLLSHPKPSGGRIAEVYNILQPMHEVLAVVAGDNTEFVEVRGVLVGVVSVALVLSCRCQNLLPGRVC